jgi:hypothetical protein
MKNNFEMLLDIDLTNTYNDWDSAAEACVNRIFDFSDQCGYDHIFEIVNKVDCYVLENRFLMPASLLNNTGISQYIEYLKDLIDYYIDKQMHNIDPAKLRTSYIETDPIFLDSVQIHQAWFLLASHCSIKMFEVLKDDPEYGKFINTWMNPSLVTTTVIKKQHDYGPENIAKFGMWGIIVRLHDKIARLDNLLSTKRSGFNSVADETVYDTLLDIVGYSTVALLWINNWFFFPMKKDVK